MEVDVVSLASEFPNDNPALHHGVIWVCLEPTAAAQPYRAGRDRPSLTEPDEGESEPAVRLEPTAAAQPYRAQRDRPSLTEPDEGESQPTPELEPTTTLDEPAIELGPASDEPRGPTVAVGGAAEASVELEDEEEAAIVVEELDPVEVSVEGVAPSPGEAQDVDFPDDSGVVLCDRADVSEPPASEVVLAEPEPEADVAPVFDSIPPDESAAAQIDSSALPPPPDDPFTVLVCTLADVALQAGSPRVAAILPGLLFDGRLPKPLDPDLADALRDAGLLDGTGVARSLVDTASAWRAILRGTSDDFTSCGAAMLDEWASDLLARMLCAPASAPTLRKELRMRGVAAFGLVEVAA